MGYKQVSPIPILEGGTNSVSFAFNHGVVVFEGLAQISIDPGLSGNVLTSNGPLLPPSFQASSPAFSWIDQTMTPVAMVVNTGYIMNDGATLITATLPATAVVGSTIRIAGNASGLWTIAQNAGQTIHFGSVNTTTGVTGSLSSSSTYDTIELLCTVANTDFVVLSSVGNLSYV